MTKNDEIGFTRFNLCAHRHECNQTKANQAFPIWEYESQSSRTCPVVKVILLPSPDSQAFMDTEKISGESHHSVESCALSFSGCKDWLTKNTKNVGALTNLYALKNMCKAEEDGSQLPGAHSLSLNSAGAHTKFSARFGQLAQTRKYSGTPNKALAHWPWTPRTQIL